MHNKYSKSSNVHLTVCQMHKEFSKIHTKLGIHISRLSWQSLMKSCSCFDFVQYVVIKCSGVMEECTATTIGRTELVHEAAELRRDKGNELVTWIDLANHNYGIVEDGKDSS